MSPAPQITALLEKLEAGDPHAADQLLPQVYEQLHGLAAAIFRGRGQGHTLQPTAIVHEAWMKLAGGRSWENRRHFFAVAGKAMRQVLSDHARAARTQKRGDAMRRVTLFEEEVDAGGAEGLDLLALDDALGKLGRANERYVRVFELHYLGGLSTAEVAEELGVTQRTVQLDWRAARALLQRELGEG